MSMFNDISCGGKGNEEECLANAEVVKVLAKRFGIGHWSLVLVLRKSGTLSKKTVHKESGTKLQKGCWWNSLRIDVQFSGLRLHYLEVIYKAKEMVNCWYTMQPIRKRLRLFFPYLFLQTSSVFTEQSQTCVKSMNPFTKERGDLIK